MNRQDYKVVKEMLELAKSIKDPKIAISLLDPLNHAITRHNRQPSEETKVLVKEYLKTIK